MSALAPRNRGGNTSRGSRGAANSPPNRGTSRGRQANAARGTTRGRGTSAGTSAAGAGEGLLQKLRTGGLQRGSTTGANPGGRGKRKKRRPPGAISKAKLTDAQGRGTPRASTAQTARGKGRGHFSKTTFDSPASDDSTPNSRPAPPASFSANTATAATGDVKQKYDVVRSTLMPTG